MSRTLDVSNLAALRDTGRLAPRNFLRVTARDRSDGDPSVHCFWDDLDDVTASVPNEGGGSSSHTFHGGAVLGIDPIPMRIGLEVRSIQIELSQLDVEVANLVRGDDPRGATVEIFRGLLSPVSMQLVAMPAIRFLGKVNGAPIETPPAGGEGKVILRVVSHTRELTRTNPAKKSDAQQQLRSGDRFRRYIGTTNWDVWWGEAKGE